jgi:hypothetical protein
VVELATGIPKCNIALEAIITGAISMYASFSFFEKAISCPHVWFVMLLSFAYLECWILFYYIGKLE